ncbi:hypothetical protein ACI79J_16080 [Geodermatophilus sp. SYSU D01062]
MTEPTRPRPVPGPPRPGPAGVPARPVAAGPAVDAAAAGPGAGAGAGAPEQPGARFADLAQRPVGEHVAVFEAEHDRLKAELGTIDQL